MHYINISELIGEIESEIVDVPPGLHALHSPDYTAAFMNKGKLKPYQLMVISQLHTNAMC